MSIERYRRRHLPDLLKDDGAEPIIYDQEADAEPTWEYLLPEIRKKAETEIFRATRRRVDATWASFQWRPTIHRNAQGESYRRQWAWAIGPTGLTHVEARQRGTLWGRRFTPRGKWAVTANHVAPSRSTVIRSLLAAPATTRALGGSLLDGSRPLSDGYRGLYPDVWSNLPLTVRQALAQAVPHDITVHEQTCSQISWDDRSVTECIWFDRRGTETLAAAVATRTNPAIGRARTGEQAAAWVRGLDWDVIAIRAPLTARSSLQSGDATAAIRQDRRKSLGRYEKEIPQCPLTRSHPSPEAHDPRDWPR